MFVEWDVNFVLELHADVLEKLYLIVSHISFHIFISRLLPNI